MIEEGAVASIMWVFSKERRAVIKRRLCWGQERSAIGRKYIRRLVPPRAL